ncbi:hypothetical protein [Pelagicoccus albus]|uniref:hypothetical protein n=1 Tax=Pelagicoccus albus TaxID=415222 RepID=UPI003CCD1D5B
MYRSLVLATSWLPHALGVEAGTDRGQRSDSKFASPKMDWGNLTLTPEMKPEIFFSNSRMGL